MNGGVFLSLGVIIFFGFTFWMFFTTIQRHRSMRLQAEMQNKLLDKFASGQELLNYVESDAGKQFLNSITTEPKRPYGRILFAVQAGVLLLFFGAALLYLRDKVGDAEQGFRVFGTVCVALGAGFAASAGISYYLSKSFGLFKNGHAQ